MFDIFEKKMVKEKIQSTSILWLNNGWVGVPFLSLWFTPTHSYMGVKNGYRKI